MTSSTSPMLVWSVTSLKDDEISVLMARSTVGSKEDRRFKILKVNESDYVVIGRNKNP